MIPIKPTIPAILKISFSPVKMRFSLASGFQPSFIKLFREMAPASIQQRIAKILNSPSSLTKPLRGRMV